MNEKLRRMSEPNILIINHTFPPEQGVATYRVSKFAKYLSELGWNVFVLTRDNNVSTNIGENIPGVKVKRDKIESENNRLLNSPELLWSRPLISSAVDMINEHDIDVIFHSAPEFIPLCSLPVIKRKTSVPYVVDLRDPWSVGPSFSSDDLRGKLYDILTFIAEPIVIGESSLMVANTPNMNRIYSEKYDQQSEKFHTLTNGFDEEIFDKEKRCNSEHFRIIYPGKFRTDMSELFQAYEKFIAGKNDVRFDHFGKKSGDIFKQVVEVTRELNIEDTIFFNGYVSRDRVISEMMNADVGIAVTRPNDPTHVPSKIYDYLACHLPIVCIDDSNGATHDILSDIEYAYVVERNNTDRIYQLLKGIYKEDPNCAELRDVSRYTRKCITRDLSELLRSELPL